MASFFVSEFGTQVRTLFAQSTNALSVNPDHLVNRLSYNAYIETLVSKPIPPILAQNNFPRQAFSGIIHTAIQS